MRTIALFGILPLQKEPRFLVTFFVQIMQQIRRGAARQTGGQRIQPAEDRQEIGLGVSLHVPYSLLQLNQGIENRLLGLGHAVEITYKQRKRQA